MAVHAVLVEWDQQVDPVAYIADLLRAGANGQERVPASNDGLVGVVRVEIQAAPAEDFCEDIARSGHTLAGRASDADGKGLLHCTLAD